MLENDDESDYEGGECFAPLPKSTLFTRSTSNASTVLYSDLSDYLFTPKEKEFFCAAVDGDIGSNKMSMVARCSRYRIPYNTVKKWLSKYRKHRIQYKYAGKPCAFTEEMIEECKIEFAKNRQLKSTPVAIEASTSANASVLGARKPRNFKSVPKKRYDPAETKKILNLMYRKSQSQQHRKMVRQAMCRNTLLATKKRMNIKTTRGGDMTQARLLAGQNPRSAYTMYLMLEAFASRLDAHNKFNSDATQITCDSDSKGGYTCYIDNVDDTKPPSSTNYSGELSMAVKWMHLNNGAGEVAPTVLVFAIPTMPEGSFFVRKIVGLRNTAHHDSFGYIIFCKTRGGNEAVWSWYFSQFAIPFIRELLTRRQLKNFDGSIMRAFWAIDGEAIILKEAYNPSILALLKEANIDLGKSPKSDTGNHQPSDRSPVFKNCNTGMKTLTNDPSIDYSCTIIERNVKDAICQFDAEYPSCAISSKNKNRVVNACQKISYVCSNYMNPSKVAAGYKVCGQHISPDEREGVEADLQHRSSISYDLIMKQSFCNLESDTLQAMKLSSPALVEEFRRTGTVTDASMDLALIPRMIGDEGKEHSTEVYWKGLAGMVTTDDSISKYCNYVQEQLDSKDPLKISAKKALAKALKALAANQKKLAATEAKEAKAAAAKVEKLRRSRLTPTERQNEDAEKKRLKAIKDAEETARNMAIVAANGFMDVDDEEGTSDSEETQPDVDEEDEDIDD